ncbi:polyhydroxybutyrate depolymerase [Frankia sp. EI5c]|uniref:alpha/beta hydrolase family esterase n=1 Tax=Frankia sp. EI5c TaxID=683316 RepID=UPI0007C2E2EF|nr:prolyl oligopeptidase family serine peptidase [Frankia sp. EI5c]OAA24687.1 polyhydroxybutyrate depolymerase [Frankia sp. EI5c]
MALGGRYTIAILAALALPLTALAVARTALDGSADPTRPAAASAAHIVVASPTTASPTTVSPAADGATAGSGVAAAGDAAAGDAAAVGFGFPGTEATDPGGSHTTEITLRSGRSYELHTTARAGKARPLVILLHAYRHDAATMRDLSGATPFSEVKDFVLAYGHAIGGAWNSGSCCAGTNRTDDVAYLRELVADAETRTPVDPTRIYVWGYSNGGMMAARAVCEAPEIFAAAGVVAGGLLVPCEQAPIRMMHIHGTADTTVPWRGGWSDYVQVSFPDSRTESSRVTSSSVVTGVPWPGGHEWPWWATGLLWDFSAPQRLVTPPASAR